MASHATDCLNYMITSRKLPEEQPPIRVRWPDVEQACKLIDHWLDTDAPDGDTTEWETLKKLLDEDRLADRKFFPNE